MTPFSKGRASPTLRAIKDDVRNVLKCGIWCSELYVSRGRVYYTIEVRGAIVPDHLIDFLFAWDVIDLQAAAFNTTYIRIRGRRT